MQLPHPLSARLAGCGWLERHVAKTRVFLRGSLPWSYRIALGSRVGVDGYFFRHFGLRKAEVLAAVRAHPAEPDLVAWFRGQPGVSADRIRQWNDLLPRLGAPGQPGHVTRHIVKWFLYPRSLRQPVASLVEAICQDEGLPPAP
jgi:hypothetical protein